MIDKVPVDADRFSVDRRFAGSARAAFAHLLTHVAARGGRILLPAYIGQSPLEGSGVFDPIVAAGVPFAFYRVDRELRVDLADLEARLDEEPAFAVFVIHYFGAAEPGLAAIAEAARRRGVLLVEDCAHSIDSSSPDGPIGSIGDYALYSIHKVLAVETGGYLRVNRSKPAIAAIDSCPIEPAVRRVFDRADWPSIRRRRVENYRRLADAIAGIAGVELFWPELLEGVVPQNLPLRITVGDRFEVYKRMRADGVGVVALYHTLIEPIDPDRYPASHEVSRTILNLPIHQDVELDELPMIARSLRAAVLD